MENQQLAIMAHAVLGINLSSDDELAPALNLLESTIKEALGELTLIESETRESSSDVPMEDIETRLTRLREKILSAHALTNKAKELLTAACRQLNTVQTKWKELKKEQQNIKQENGSLKQLVNDLKDEVGNLKTSVEALKEQIKKKDIELQSHQTQIDDLKTSHENLEKKLKFNNDLLLQAQIVTELQTDVKNEVASVKRPRLEYIEKYVKDSFGSKLINHIKTIFKEVKDNDETEFQCLNEITRAMTNERNGFAHCDEDKAKVCTLYLKNLFKGKKYEDDYRCVLKLLCLSRNKAWSDDDDPTLDANINVFPLMP